MSFILRNNASGNLGYDYHLPCEWRPAAERSNRYIPFVFKFFCKFSCQTFSWKNEILN